MLLFKLLTGFTQSRTLNDYPEHLLDVVSVFDHTPIAICFEQLMNAMQMVLTTSCSLFSLGNIFKQLLQGVGLLKIWSNHSGCPHSQCPRKTGIKCGGTGYFNFH